MSNIQWLLFWLKKTCVVPESIFSCQGGLRGKMFENHCLTRWGTCCVLNRLTGPDAPLGWITWLRLILNTLKSSEFDGKLNLSQRRNFFRIENQHPPNISRGEEIGIPKVFVYQIYSVSLPCSKPFQTFIMKYLTVIKWESQATGMNTIEIQQVLRLWLSTHSCFSPDMLQHISTNSCKTISYPSLLWRN
jgi:hypothetical protein